jgi:hypothetical protein
MSDLFSNLDVCVSVQFDLAVGANNSRSKKLGLSTICYSNKAFHHEISQKVQTFSLSAHAQLLSPQGISIIVVCYCIIRVSFDQLNFRVLFLLDQL